MLDPVLAQPSFGAYSATRLPSGDRRCVASAQHPPAQNRILAALRLPAYERLLPDLEPFPLPLGWAVHNAGEREDYLYFITSGIVSRYCGSGNGASSEFAVTGSEGVIGVSSFLGGESMVGQSVVLSAGYSYRLRADLLQNDIEHHYSLLRLLLRYTLALIAQTGQIAACNRHHSLEQQLCRWILECLDRLLLNELTVTHEVIATMLGVRRESVTTVAGKLQKAGLIHCSRARIAVLDRPQLEARACECYAVVKREYERLRPKCRRAEVTS
jgi:CRP-like cAMP-binding protein